MSKLKEAAALALDALEECQYATTSKADKMVDTAMNALRAALAEDTLQHHTDAYQGMEKAGERAELIELLRVNAAQTLSYQHFKQCHQAADMLEADEKPEYVPLTDDEIIKVAKQHLVLIDNGEFAFARAIERAARGAP